MPTVKVRNLKNEEVGEVELSAALFDAPLNEGLIHAAVRNFMANGRQGTSATKTRGDVSGSGRKLWKQKGTGRARAGSNTSPLWTGGGVAFLPRPRSYTSQMNAKSRMKALCGALTSRAKDGSVVIVDAPAMDQPKTQTMAALIEAIGLTDKKVLWVFDKLDANAWKSTRNLAKVETTESRTLHTYALMNCDCLVLTEGGLKSLAERVNA